MIKREKKSGPRKKWRYSEYDVIEGDIIEGFDCMCKIWAKNFDILCRHISLEVYTLGYKEGKFKILIWTLNTINFVLKLISMMHWFQNCLQNQNPLHINLEINKSVFSYFPFSGNFLYLGIFPLQGTNYESFSILLRISNKVWGQRYR